MQNASGIFGMSLAPLTPAGAWNPHSLGAVDGERVSRKRAGILLTKCSYMDLTSKRWRPVRGREPF